MNIPHLPSSMRLSLYPLRLRSVTLELTLLTTLFTWLLSKSHHDMFNCSILHRKKTKHNSVSKRQRCTMDKTGCCSLDNTIVTREIRQSSWPAAGLEHVSQSVSREAGAAAQVELQQVWVFGHRAEWETGQKQSYIIHLNQSLRGHPRNTRTPQ